MKNLKSMLICCVAVGITYQTAANAGPTKIYVCGPNQTNEQELLSVGDNIRKRIREVEMSTGGFRYVNVSLKLTVVPDGRLTDISIARSSGRDDIDQSILELVKKSVPFSPYPVKLGTLNFKVAFSSHELLGDKRFRSDFTVGQLADPVRDNKQPDSKQTKRQADAYAISGQSNH